MCLHKYILLHPSFLRGVKFNFDEMQPNFLWVIMDPHRAQKGCETNVSRREIFHFRYFLPPPRFELRTPASLSELLPLTYTLKVPPQKILNYFYSLLGKLKRVQVVEFQSVQEFDIILTLIQNSDQFPLTNKDNTFLVHEIFQLVFYPQNVFSNQG